jgi:MoaA/NifB/PqqE/SkfB family radical SAM enzyme
MRDMYVYLIPSFMCNMRHVFCYQTSFAPTRLSDRILYGRLLPLYPRIAVLRLHGGEITIIPGMKEYIAWLKRSYPAMRVNVVTNGQLFNEEWVDLARKHSLLVNLSLNATSAEATARIINSGDAAIVWQRIYGNFLRLAEAHWASPSPLLNAITMVVADDTVDEIPRFVRLALKYGVNVMLQYPCSPNAPTTQRVLGSVTSAVKLGQFVDDYITVKYISLPACEKELSLDVLREEKRAFLRDLDFEPKAARWRDVVAYDDTGIPGDATRCELPWKGLAIHPTGGVMPCSGLPGYVIGNLNYESIDVILSTASLAELRRLVAAGDYHYCWQLCGCNLRAETSVPGAGSGYRPAYELLFEQGEYTDVVQQLDAVEDFTGVPADVVYKYAYSLHMTGRADASRYYALALEKGFDEFWVRYNRGCLYHSLEREDEALEDLCRAVDINPAHDGAARVLQAVRERVRDCPTSELPRSSDL